MNYRFYSLWVILLISSTFVVNSHAQKSPAKKAVETPRTLESSRKSPFRYVIVSGVSEIERYVNENPELLSIEVLLEDKAFNEKNLLILFNLLSERFNEKRGLSVGVYTSLDAILTPEENDGLPLKGPPEDYEKYKYAFYNRNGNGEYFSYGIPNHVKRKYVVIKPPDDDWPGTKK